MRYFALISIAAVGACQRGALELDRATPVMTSNIRAADYIGPAACGQCHASRFEAWSANLHRSMNRAADDDDAIVGDFSSVDAVYGGGVARFYRDQGEPRMRLSAKNGRVEVYRVTRTIGSRYIQEYVGVRISDPPSDTEVRLPFGYWLRERRWLHQQYFDAWYGPEYDATGAIAIDPMDVDPTPWASRCAWCHNTYPFELRLARAGGTNAGGHGPEFFYTLADEPPVSGNLLPIESLVTVGISCESCHLGGREHAEGAAIQFRPHGEGVATRADVNAPSGKRDAASINSICLQCHSAPSPKWPSGAAMRNSAEAIDLMGGACASAIKCTDCHDPHVRGEPAGAATSATHLAACTRCHTSLAADEARARHAQHDAKDANCIDCHMPAIVQGFSGPLRTHRISSPTPDAILGGREPDACGICHLDRKSRELAVSLATGWGLRSSRAYLAEDIDATVGQRWLGADVALQAVAAAAYGLSERSHSPAIAGALIAKLSEPIAYYRMRFLFALEAVLGRDIGAGEFDPAAPPSQRALQQGQLLESI